MRTWSRNVKRLAPVPVLPSGFVTTTSSVAQEPQAAVTAVICVELTTLTWVAGWPPMLTARRGPFTKPLPVMVTWVPPREGPVRGPMEVTVGAAVLANVNAWLRTTEVPSGLVTRTLLRPAVAGGVVTVSWLELTNTTFAAGTLPKSTWAPAAMPLPERVTRVPPLSEPEIGVMPVMVGAEEARNV
jgi:hypothetical protein